jgi:hypothetical protein
VGGVINRIGQMLCLIGGKRGERYIFGASTVALVFAGWCAFYLTPQLSLHLSNKGLFEIYHTCRADGEKLAQYQVPGRGAVYYNNGEVEELRSQDQLFQTLRDSNRWFVLVPSTQLAQLDQAARQAKVTYYVLDDRSSQFLILSNQLRGSCNKDLNPLRRYVLDHPPKVPKAISANFENKVKLLGYSVADEVTRGGKFPITLYFQVLDKVPSGYKLFLHFDQPAARFHGDHEPLDGKFPTQYWLPGEYIIDTHEVEIPFITTSSGPYTIYMGFWRGEERLKVVAGPNDGSNRVPIGRIRVK